MRTAREQRSAAGRQTREQGPLPPLTGPRLIAARVAWLLVVGLSVAVFIAAFSPFVTNYYHLCGPEPCKYVGQLTPAALRQVNALGVSFGAYVAFRGALTVLGEVVWLGTALFLFVRRSYDRGALVVSFMLALQQVANPADLLAKVVGPWQGPAVLISSLAWATVMTVWYVFPNGRFVPHWSRWVVLLFVATVAASVLAGTRTTNNGEPPALLGAWYVPFFLGVVLAPLYRYRRVATPVERQQMKWPVLAVAVVIALILIEGLLPSFSPAGRDAYSLIEASGLIDLLVMLIPISVAFAMLRYRLYDVDVLIRRTLVYSILTVLLAILYFGSVLVLQRLIAGATGQQPTLVLVASTLAIAALFNPLRRRVQDWVDRRFYRRKYDAGQVLAQFGTVARDETQLDELGDALGVAIDRTIQPARVGIWLRGGKL